MASKVGTFGFVDTTPKKKYLLRVKDPFWNDDPFFKDKVAVHTVEASNLDAVRAEIMRDFDSKRFSHGQERIFTIYDPKMNKMYGRMDVRSEHGETVAYWRSNRFKGEVSMDGSLKRTQRLKRRA